MEIKAWHILLKKKLYGIPKPLLILMTVILAYPVFYIIFGLPVFAANLTSTGKPGALFFLFLLFGFGQLRHLKVAYDSIKWPFTTGTIISSDVMGIDHESWPSITYQYSLDGKNYESSEVSTKQKNQYMYPHQAEAIVDKYPVGQNVKVYYQRKNPNICYLEIGVSSSNWLLSIFFLSGLIATGIWVATIWQGFDPERFKNIVDQIPAWFPFDSIKDIG